MKAIFKFFAELLGVFLVLNFVSVGAVVFGLAIGVQSGMWVLWYLALFSTCVTLLAASAATIVFLVEFGHDKYHWFASSVKSRGKHHMSHGRMVFHG